MGERTRVSQWLGLSPYGFKSALDIGCNPGVAAPPKVQNWRGCCRVPQQMEVRQHLIVESEDGRVQGRWTQPHGTRHRCDKGRCVTDRESASAGHGTSDALFDSSQSHGLACRVAQTHPYQCSGRASLRQEVGEGRDGVP